jgi:hypothetical protein
MPRMEIEQQKQMWLTAYCAALNRLMAPGKSESKDMFRECIVCANRAVEAFNEKWGRPSVPTAPLRAL